MSAIEFQEEAFPIYSRFDKNRVLALGSRLQQAKLPELLPAHPELGTPRDLRCLNLNGRAMREGDFFHADLRGADFRHADLHGADFHHANLEAANFCMANVWSASFKIGRASCRERVYVLV